MSFGMISGKGSQVTVGGGTISSAYVIGDGSSLSGVTNVESDGQRTGVYAQGDVTVSIENDVSVKSEEITTTLPDGSIQTQKIPAIGISAIDDAVVTVGGNVSADGGDYMAIYAYDDSEVHVNGNVEGSIWAAQTTSYSLSEDGAVIEEKSGKNGGTVVVNGSVISENEAIVAKDGANIEVGNGVKSGMDAISVYNGATVNVNGDVLGNQHGIVSDSFGSVNIQGDVRSEDIGIEVLLRTDDGENGSLIVNGTVDAKNKAVYLSYYGGINPEDVVSAMPHIIVQTLESEGDLVVVTAPDATQEEKRALQNALLDNIYYIVNTENLDTTKIAIYGTEVVDGYVVATEESIITLESKDSGYVVCNVEAGRYATVTENPDGSVSITVERGGDLNISADVKAKGNGSRGSYVRWDDYGSPWNDWIPSYSNLWNELASSYQENSTWSGSAVQQTEYNPAPIWQPSFQNMTWDPAYALSPDYTNRVLVINLVGRQELCVLRADLESFKTMGFETVNIITEDASLYMAMSNLLELYGNANQAMFSRNGDSVELWLCGTLVVTITLVKKDQQQTA